MQQYYTYSITLLSQYMSPVTELHQ